MNIKPFLTAVHAYISTTWRQSSFYSSCNCTPAMPNSRKRRRQLAVPPDADLTTGLTIENAMLSKLFVLMLTQEMSKSDVFCGMDAMIGRRKTKNTPPNHRMDDARGRTNRPCKRQYWRITRRSETRDPILRTRQVSHAASRVGVGRGGKSSRQDLRLENQLSFFFCFRFLHELDVLPALLIESLLNKTR